MRPKKLCFNIVLVYLKATCVVGADPGPSTGDYGHGSGSDPGPLLSGEQGCNKVDRRKMTVTLRVGSVNVSMLREEVWRGSGHGGEEEIGCLLSTRNKVEGW